jgi:hypothetical protein
MARNGFHALRFNSGFATRKQKNKDVIDVFDTTPHYAKASEFYRGQTIVNHYVSVSKKQMRRMGLTRKQVLNKETNE